jgi:tRNA G18 (ribose-2'-O)-methylase SpoU
MIIPIDDPADPRLALFRNIPDPALARSAGLFVAEGRRVVDRLLQDPQLTTQSVMVTPTALASLENGLRPWAPKPWRRRPDLTVYVVPQAVMNDVTGFNIHRGCLALAERPAARDWRAVARGPDHLRQGYGGPPKLYAKADGGPLLVMERVGDADNVGSIFRSAAALGTCGVLLGPGCADPLYRKAIRTSMGASLSLPFAEATPWPGMLDELRAMGYATLALTPAADAPPLREVVGRLKAAPTAVVVGHEGDGLSSAALERCTHRARIEMEPGIDSLNVATAAALALYELRSFG